MTKFYIFSLANPRVDLNYFEKSFSCQHSLAMKELICFDTLTRRLRVRSNLSIKYSVRYQTLLYCKHPSIRVHEPYL